ncbi:Ribonuclease HII,ribonuclease HII,ribonuclease HII,Ribonuclease HII [Chlamydia serpentis]|uniref:Ribonuclease HII n=1 Tax=Chlamydia serpentis TaxID=1967782 RepID=A0A2R8FA40_9CHLA|nr:ribonuclease HII [Chlamydia serpentis]SPN73285.1 Ribonuclease HII,ribonuclease HII,ribonuclease HII,Ribonuclease HII [Chlamydia serpentis]
MNTSISDSEVQRFLSMMTFENEVASEGFSLIAGVDEAGRGPLAGPVVAGACVLPRGTVFPGINDSKKLTPKERAKIRETLVQDPKVFFGIGVVSVERIDQINILEATKEAMIEAISSLSILPDFLLVDGLYLSHVIPCKKIVRGDARSASIAAASILAKEYRDELMLKLHELYPQYGFDRHKGYGTTFHLEAIRRYGPSPCHRKTFSPIKQMCVAL